MKVEGKAFVVTGACGALGGSVAKEIIAKGGYAIVFDVLDTAKGQEVCASYHKERAIYFKVDITDIDGLNAACAEALKLIPKGSLAGGVHCAATIRVREWSPKMSDSVQHFRETINVNVFGTFAVDAAIADAINSQYPDQQTQFPERVQEERGVIVNFASAVADPVPARCLTYGPSKTAVFGITSGAADFLGPSGIRVVSISPASVASKMTGDRGPFMVSELEACAIFPRRQSRAEEVTHGVMFLIENEMINACDIRLDGAWRTISNWGGAKHLGDPRSGAPSLE